MDKLREIKISGGDFEVIRLAEDFAFDSKSEDLNLYFRKSELQKLKDGKRILESWESESDESWDKRKNFLTFYGFEYEVKVLALGV